MVQINFHESIYILFRFRTCFPFINSILWIFNSSNVNMENKISEYKYEFLKIIIYFESLLFSCNNHVRLSVGGKLLTPWGMSDTGTFMKRLSFTIYFLLVCFLHSYISFAKYLILLTERSEQIGSHICSSCSRTNYIKSKIWYSLPSW